MKLKSDYSHNFGELGGKEHDETKTNNTIIVKSGAFFFCVADHSFYRVFGVAHIAAKSSECNLVLIFLFIFWYRFMRTFCPLCTDSGFPFFCAIFFFQSKLIASCPSAGAALFICRPSGPVILQR